MARSYNTGTRVRIRDATTLPLFASARRNLQPGGEPDRLEARPEFISTGLRTLDGMLGGGLPLGEATLVAARPKMGATSLFLGTALAAFQQRASVAYFSDRLTEDQIRRRLIVLESRVNGYRFRAGFVSAEDRIAIAAARQRIPWSTLTLVTGRNIRAQTIDEHVWSYRPWLVVIDVQAIFQQQGKGSHTSAVLDSWEQLIAMARHQRLALIAHLVLPRAQHPPSLIELPWRGKLASFFNAAMFLHREEITDPTGAPAETAGRAEVQIVRLRGHEVEPRLVPLRFDQRFAGLLDA